MWSRRCCVFFFDSVGACWPPLRNVRTPSRPPPEPAGAPPGSPHRQRVQVPRTSCTRTPQAPAATASTEVAAWPRPARRSAGGCRPGGQQPAQVRLAAGADQHREPERQQRVQPAGELPVVLGGLGEPRPGSRMIRSGAIPAATASLPAPAVRRTRRRPRPGTAPARPSPGSAPASA